MKTTLVGLVAVIVSLSYMLYLAEQDAAYWHSEASEVSLLRETTRIQGIAMENFCRPLAVKHVKLASPIDVRRKR